MKYALRLIRWENLLFIAIIVWLMEKMVAVPILDAALFGEQLPQWVFYLLMLSIVFIAAGGYAINDYFDVRIDAINRPDKQIVTKDLTKQQAMLFHQVLTVIGAISGLIVAFVCRSWALGLIYIFVPGLLWFYSSSYKRQFIVGNLIVALAASLTPFMVAIANVAYMQRLYGDIMPYSEVPSLLYRWIGGFALFAFLATLIREILKDLQDQDGDRELECHTLPIRIGNTWTKIIVIILLFLLVALAAMCVFVWMPFPHGWGTVTVRYYLFGLVIPVLCELYLILSAKISSDYRFAQHLMKFIMFIGTLFSIVFYAQYSLL